MKIVRFRTSERELTGHLVGDLITPLDDASEEWGYSLGDVKLLPPCLPSKIVAIGLNYRDHAEELGLALPEEPLLFLKPSSSVVGPNDAVLVPPQSNRVDYEAELAVVMAKTTQRVSADEAADYILGYTCLNDVTARDLQGKDGQWTRAKGFDTFCPIGPWIETDIDPSDLQIALYLNDELKQQSRTSNLIFNPFRLVEFVSHVMTLLPGDVIATGTTSGIGPMIAGDEVEVRIEGIGSLFNSVGALKP